MSQLAPAPYLVQNLIVALLYSKALSFCSSKSNQCNHQLDHQLDYQLANHVGKSYHTKQKDGYNCLTNDPTNNRINWIWMSKKIGLYPQLVARLSQQQLKTCYKRSFWCHWFDKNSNENIVRISEIFCSFLGTSLKLFGASWGPSK